MSTAVSVDLDDLQCYYAIHGVARQAPSLALTTWLPRFLALFERLRIRATFFVIGHDLEADLRAGGPGAAALRQAVEGGHELASHSYAHAYDMSTWSEQRVLQDLERCDAVLREVGAEPRGFRAPGYTHGPAMLRAVAAMGYAYDSSALPSVPYYLGKVGVMAAMALRGRRSTSSIRGLASFVGPRLPYLRPDTDLVELPMSVTPRLRIPLIGTTLLGGPSGLRHGLVQRALGLDHFHLELHAIDLADPEREEIERSLPEVRTPWAVRKARLEALVRGRGPTIRLVELAAQTREACG